MALKDSMVRQGHTRRRRFAAHGGATTARRSTVAGGSAANSAAASRRSTSQSYWRPQLQKEGNEAVKKAAVEDKEDKAKDLERKVGIGMDRSKEESGRQQKHL